MNAKKLIKLFLIVFLVSFVLVILSGVITYFVVTRGTNLDKAAITPQYSQSKLYDLNGEELAYSAKSNSYVLYDDINNNIIDAFVALEDKRFFEHNGLDYHRICGAVAHNIKAGGLAEGASTITQQLAKNALLSNEKTLTRKLKEAKLAIQIEQNFSKKDIITMYLNAIYFGNGMYGLENATKRLYNKRPSEINLPEAAILAGIVKNPSKNSPLNNKDNAETRMKLVLNIMKNEGYINTEQYDAAINYHYSPIEQPKSVNLIYANSVLKEAAQILKISEKQLIAGGYKIVTHLDKNAQQHIESLVNSGSFTPEEGGDCLAMLADNKTGGIIAYYSTFENAVQDIRRQPASTIKPLFTYAPALDIGYINTSTPVLDEITDINGYKPQNYGSKYSGWTNVRAAVLKSSNVVAVKLTNEIGLDYCKEVAARMGLKFSDNDNLATALGGMYNGLTFSELIEGYMTLANEGKHQKIGFVSRIIDKSGKTIYNHKPDYNRAISQESAYLMTDMLIDTANFGTAKKLNGIGFEVASKTGTAGNSNGNTDALNLSYTTNNTLAVWYGSINNKILLHSGTTGGSYPTLLARYILKGLELPENFYVPDGIAEYEVDTYTTKLENNLYLASEKTPQAYRKKEKFDKSHINAPISTFFDELYQNFEVQTNGIYVNIECDTKEHLKYKLYKIKNDKNELLAEFTGDNNRFYYIDKQASFGLNRYFYTVESEDNELLGESEQKKIFSFSLFGN